MRIESHSEGNNISDTGSHVLLIGKTKQQRRTLVEKEHNIIMLFGDNLHDFADFFDADSPAARHQAVQKNAAKFGKRFILLPNAGYGAWNPAYGNWQDQNLDS